MQMLEFVIKIGCNYINFFPNLMMFCFWVKFLGKILGWQIWYRGQPVDQRSTTTRNSAGRGIMPTGSTGKRVVCDSWRPGAGLWGCKTDTEEEERIDSVSSIRPAHSRLAVRDDSTSAGQICQAQRFLGSCVYIEVVSPRQAWGFPGFVMQFHWYPPLLFLKTTGCSYWFLYSVQCIWTLPIQEITLF